MIRKTFSTIKKYPLFILFYFILIAFNFFSNYLEGVLLKSISEAMSVGIMYNAFLYSTISWFCTLLKTIGLALLFYAPVVYYTSLTATDSVHSGWFKMGIKRGWWRYILIFIAVSLLNAVLFLIITFAFTAGASHGVSMMVRVSMKTYLLSTLMASITFWAVCPLIAEETFFDGITNLFKIHIKNFWKILLAYAVLYLLERLASGRLNLYNIENARFGLSLIITPAITLIMYIFSMNLYVSAKQEARKTETEIDTEEIIYD